MDQMTALRFQTGGRHQTSPASLRGSLVGNLGRLTWVRLQHRQKLHYPFLKVCAILPCVQTKVWLPVIGLFNVHTGVHACDCTRGLYRHRKRVCSESWLWEKKPSPHPGTEPASTACLSNALPTELHPRPSSQGSSQF